MVNKLKNLVKNLIYKLVPPPVVEILNSYSQAGEDSVISFLFSDKKESTPTYLDLGTNLPNTGNNTYLFYLAGSKGVCVEADPALIEVIKKVRPNDKVLNFGVSTVDNQELEFYVFDTPAINTFDREEALKREKSGVYSILRKDRILTKTINTLILENFDRYPDFLSIDIEGLDLDVLKSLDYTKYPIPVICVETCIYSENHIRPKDKSLEEFMTSIGYFVYADTYINTIFVNQNWFFGK
jgi:FkbM family methyltransferase